MDRDFHVRAAVRFLKCGCIHVGAMPEPYWKNCVWR